MSKKNFRCTDDRAWLDGLDKAETMRRHGYDIDMTAVLNNAVRQFTGETEEETAERFGLTRAEAPVPAYRKPFARAAE